MEPVTRAILVLWEALASEPNMGRLLKTVVRTAEMATGAASGEIVLTDDSWSRLEYQFAQPEELAMLQNLRNKLGRRIIGVITRDRCRLQIEDAADGDDGANVTPAPGCLTLPMTLEGRPLGRLTLAGKAGGFSPDDREFLASFLGQVGVAIERELMRVRLAKVETRLQGVFDAIADGLLVCDRHSKPILANRSFRQMFFPPGAPNQALPAVLPSLLDSPADRADQEVVLLKPHARILSSSFVRTRGPDGGVQEMVLSLRDITLSKRLDQKFLQLVTLLVRRLEHLLEASRKARRKPRRQRLQARLRTLARNLVCLTELKAGPLRVSKLPLTPREWLEEARPLLEKTLSRRRLSLTWPDLPDEADEMVFADSEVLTGALRTLTRHLAGQVAPGTSITLAVAVDGPLLRIAFQTPAKAWKHMPDPADLDWETCVERFLGEGRKTFSVALAFVRHIMEAHKGGFTCDAGPDQVAFTLILPKGGL